LRPKKVSGRIPDREGEGRRREDAEGVEIMIQWLATSAQVRNSARTINQAAIVYACKRHAS
jgi:hypothetical protein